MVICEHQDAFWVYTWDPQHWHTIGEDVGPRTRRFGALERQTADLVKTVAREFLSSWERTLRLQALEKDLLLLKRRVRELEERADLTIPVESLAPEPFEVLRPFHVVVQAQDEGYIATFFDANLSASGDTREESVANLKDLIVGVYKVLARHTEDRLGPGPAKQLHALRAFIAPRS